MPTAFQSALVTGGAGFIGSHLVEALVASGCRVAVLDDLSSGRESNLEPVAGRITFVRGSICDRHVLAKAAAGCEVVFHLAAVVSVPKTVDDPLGSAVVNETGSLNVLEAARGAQARAGGFCQLERRVRRRPDAAEARGHAAQAVDALRGSEACRRILPASLPIAVWLGNRWPAFFQRVRPAQDPSSPYSGVISIFMNKALNGERPGIYGDGRQTRDFVFVGDVVQALISAAASSFRPGQGVQRGHGKVADDQQVVEGDSGTCPVPRQSPFTSRRVQGISCIPCPPSIPRSWIWGSLHG